MDFYSIGLLSAPFDYFAELRQIVDRLYPVQLESECAAAGSGCVMGDQGGNGLDRQDRFEVAVISAGAENFAMETSML